MFIYSLSGLELKDTGQQAVEIEENETTARSATYQVFGRFFAGADDEHYEMATSDQWTKEFATAVELLSFDFDPGSAPSADSVSKDDYLAEFARVFQGTPAIIIAGSHFDDAEQNLAEVVRFYEYFGLQAGDESDRPPDHLGTECDFMQFVTFKEAASPSERLAGSYRRAQLDFHDRQLSLWIPGFTEKVSAAGTLDVFNWAAERLAAFVAADHAHIREVTGG